MKALEGSDLITVEIEAVIEDGRLIQVFDCGEHNQEWCVHGIKLRWSCDKCEDYLYAHEPKGEHE